jgi:hypothetical protein
MPPLLTVPVQVYEVCRPAAGTRAAFNSQDFGTSHWQLVIDGYTSFTRLQKGAVPAAKAALPRRSASRPLRAEVSRRGDAGAWSGCRRHGRVAVIPG